jgi:hypothetical protein
VGGRSRKNAFGADKQAEHGEANTIHSEGEIGRSLSEYNEQIDVVRL